MKFNFKIYEITAATNNSICAATPTLVSSGLSVDITVIEKDGSTTVIPTSTSNTQSVDVVLENSWDKATVIVNIAKTDYNTYSNSFEVYGYDLGNYANDSFNNVAYFDIILIKTDYRTTDQKNPVHPDYIPYILNLAYSSFISYRKPFTKELHAYTTNSSNGVVKYFNSNNELIIGAKNGFICCDGEYALYQVTQTYGSRSCCCGGSVLLDECISSVLTITNWIYLPTYLSTNTCNSCDSVCTNTISENYTNLTVDFSEVTCLYVDTVLISPIQHYQVNWTLYGIDTEISPDGNFYGVPLTTHSIDLEDHVDFTCPITVDNGYGSGSYFNYNFPVFVTPDIGDYKVHTTYSVMSYEQLPVITCSEVNTITSCNWFNYDKLECECNQFNLYNKSFQQAEINVYKLNGNGFGIYNTFIMESCSSLRITLLDDGVYMFSAIRLNLNDTKLEFLPFVNICKLTTCWLEYQKSVLCDCKKCNSQNVYNYNVLQANMFILLSMMNNSFTFGSVYSYISDSLLKDFITIDTIIQRINDEYCINCNLPSPCSSEITANSSSGDCGCK